MQGQDAVLPSRARFLVNPNFEPAILAGQNSMRIESDNSHVIRLRLHLM
jgi:hypothetical protein